MRRIAIVLSFGLIMSMGMAATVYCNEMFPAKEIFPADVNDSWVLQRFSQPSSDVRVTAYTRTGWLRFDGLFDMTPWLLPQGTKVFARGEAAQKRQLLYDFSAAQGTSWNVELGRLVGSVTVVEKDARVATAFGPRTGCTAFGFLWDNLADAGVAMQWFCPGIGLVKQDKLSIAGVQTEHTVAAAIRGAIGIGYLGQGMNVRLERGSAECGCVLKARLELWDTTDTLREFRSETSQLFDLRIVNDRGETVRLWSWDKVFLPVVTTWVLEADKDFDAELLLSDRNGQALPPGLYTVEGWIIDSLARPTAATQIRLD